MSFSMVLVAPVEMDADDCKVLVIEACQQLEDAGYTPAPDGDFTVECRDYSGNWTPDPAVETHPAADLEAMFLKLALDFVTGLRTIGSPIADTAPFTAWATGDIRNPDDTPPP